MMAQQSFASKEFFSPRHAHTNSITIVGNSDDVRLQNHYLFHFTYEKYTFHVSPGHLRFQYGCDSGIKA